MQDMLDGFIKQFVLCEKCENPETVLEVKENMIGASCKACGHIYTMDMRHRLTTFIVKNPPEEDIDSEGSSQTETGKKRRRKRRRVKRKIGSGGSDKNNVDDDWREDGDDGVWFSDTRAEAIAKRAQEQLTSGISSLVINSDVEKTEEERINTFFKFVQVKRGMINSRVAKEILAEAERLEIKNKAPVVLCELLFNDKIIKERQINKYAKLLLRFTHENPEGQKYLIGGIEKVVESFEATLLPKVPHIFNELLAEDILDEEAIFEWAKEVSKKHVSNELAQKIHDKAAPLIKWFQEAKEESSDGCFPIEYDSDKYYCHTKISKLKEVETSQPTNNVDENQKKEQSNDDDLDDDDIDNI